MARSGNVSDSCTVTAMPPRVSLTIRVTPKAKTWIDDNAEAYTVNQSTVVRAMLSVATQHPNEVIKAIQAIKEAG